MTPVHIRPCNKSDIPAILGIQKGGVDEWGEELLSKPTKLGDVHISVAESQERVVGFVVYKRERTGYDVMKMGVAEAHRDKGVAGQLLEHVVGKMNPVTLRRVGGVLPETEDAALVACKKLGFKTSLKQGNFEGDGCDGVVIKTDIETQFDRVSPAQQRKWIALALQAMTGGTRCHVDAPAEPGKEAEAVRFDVVDDADAAAKRLNQKILAELQIPEQARVEQGRVVVPVPEDVLEKWKPAMSRAFIESHRMREAFKTTEPSAHGDIGDMSFGFP